MSTLLMSIKVGFGSIAALSAVGVTGFALSGGFDAKNNSGTPVKNYVVVKQKTTDNASALEQNKDLYKCKLPSTPEAIDDACVVKLLHLNSDHKKHIQIEQLNSETWKSPDDFSVGKYYKVEVTENLFNALKTSTTKTLNIFRKGVSDTKVGTFDVLFDVNKDGVVSTKMQYAVAKVSGFNKGESGPVENVNEITISDTETKCVFSTQISCSIYQFSTPTKGELNSLTFSTSDKKQTTITKDSYYLFKLDSSENSKILSEFKTVAKAKVVLSPSVNSGDKSGIDTINLSDVKPAIITSQNPSDLIFLFTA